MTDTTVKITAAVTQIDDLLTSWMEELGERVRARWNAKRVDLTITTSDGGVNLRFDYLDDDGNSRHHTAQLDGKLAQILRENVDEILEDMIRASKPQRRMLTDEEANAITSFGAGE